MSRSNSLSESDDARVYSVTELTQAVKSHIESGFGTVWVEGELSNVKHHSSGHLYFSLKDEGAALSGVMFKSRASRVRFKAEDGQRVRLRGDLTVYERQGRYQVIASRLEPLGVGELELAWRQLFARLQKEGLFDEARKQPIPRYPRTVGIVTSPTGAAVRDIMDVLGRRAPHVTAVLCPARVQGEGAAEEVAGAVADLDDWGGADVLIVGRGGGSLEDLWAFNEEVLARALVECRTPVISAVGHEVDHTIADAVADLRAPTPSAAAELAVPDREALLSDLASLGDRLVTCSVRELVEVPTEVLERTGGRMARAVAARLKSVRERVDLRVASSAFRRPLEFYRRRSQDVDGLRERVDTAMRILLENRGLRVGGAAGSLRALSPLAVLERGYAAVRSGAGDLIRSAHELAPGNAIEVQLQDGAVDCTVDSVRVCSDEAATCAEGDGHGS
ncbi:MAG: exodeoxyribonuclease VII large subunit [Gemmatimonadota bacterium]|jgi:exodeoxyribonuclease VII large subunit|nr:exodeoxyribonuclease VII large subunit [Gemmatimonadota bacterium]MDP6530000.1 exodeoxyribonuclease VII large subunit [Gemmatimonadota bacterium]MDP6802095.1 exodeoxyribonuclease VII large subunit [Gemmatimonadota bacterium]MDP7032647.1 exodeoxyribonuclease VII large subunit [Gemmatimonadota bacterium]